MTKHFLKYIKIEKFKCFDNFKISGFKRVNLISGRNNIGKTTLLEACYINMNINNEFSILQFMYSMSIGIHLRSHIDFSPKDSYSLNIQKEFDKIKKYKSNSNLNSLTMEVATKSFKSYYVNINGNENHFTPKEFEFNTEIGSDIKYINSKEISNESIVNSFEVIQLKDKEKDLNKYIKEFDNRIEAFKIIGNKPVCKINNIYREINEFGSGLKLYIAIITKIYSLENGALFIDEIENGIHYSQFSKLWELIFKISKDVNCQIFATTHSKEAIFSYNKVQNNLNDNKSTFINLELNKDNEIIYGVLDKEMLEYELEQNHEVR